jgi:hypothetical protein
MRPTANLQIKRDMLSTHSLQAVLMLAWGNSREAKTRAVLDREETLGRCEMEIPLGNSNMRVCNRLAAVTDLESERTYCIKCFEEYCS